MLLLVPPKTKVDVPKSLAWLPSKISEPDAVTATVVAPPVAVITPDSVILPPAVRERVLPTPIVPVDNAALFVTVTAFAPLFERDTAPVKLLLVPLVDKSIALAPAVKLDVPGATNAPVCETAPTATIVKLLPTVDAASEVALLFVKVTLLVPLFESAIAPVKLLLVPFVVKSIALAPAVKLEVPGTVNAPVCETAPTETSVKLFPTVDDANDVALLLVTVTLLEPLLDNVIAPVKLLLVPFVVKSIALAPAVKFAVPGTVIAPV